MHFHRKFIRINKTNNVKCIHGKWLGLLFAIWMHFPIFSSTICNLYSVRRYIYIYILNLLWFLLNLLLCLFADKLLIRIWYTASNGTLYFTRQNFIKSCQWGNHWLWNTNWEFISSWSSETDFETYNVVQLKTGESISAVFVYVDIDQCVSYTVCIVCGYRMHKFYM